jgi:hypothetical protein
MSDVYPAAHRPDRTAPARRSVSPAVYVVAVLVVAAVAALTIVFLVARKADSPARRAINACEDTIKDQVEGPPPAKFSGVTATDNGDGTWDVFGTVAGSGSSGAAASHSFTCSETEQNGDFEVTDSSVFYGVFPNP